MNIYKITLFASLLFISMGAQAANCKHTYNKFKCIEVVSIYDGDSIRVNIDKLHPLFGEDVPVRISNVDTAERYGRAPCEREMANLARNFIHHRISLAKNRKQIELRNPIRDKYFRINAELWVNGFSIGRALIKEGLAVAYFGGTKPSVNWCELKERVPSYILNLEEID